MLDSNRISISFLIPEGEIMSEAEIELISSITEEISAMVKEYDQKYKGSETK